MHFDHGDFELAMEVNEYPDPKYVIEAGIFDREADLSIEVWGYRGGRGVSTDDVEEALREVLEELRKRGEVWVVPD
ncbi:MAG: hypothetical protein QW247_10705 [Pyrobaculum sp.]